MKYLKIIPMTEKGMISIRRTLEENKKTAQYKFYTRLYSEVWHSEENEVFDVLYIRLLKSKESSVFDKIWLSIEEIIRKGIIENGGIIGEDFITVLEDEIEGGVI